MGTERARFRTMANNDGAAILDAHSGRIITLNPTGAYVWQALQRGDSAETIAADLVLETGAELDVVQHGIATFLSELKEQCLLAIDSDGGEICL